MTFTLFFLMKKIEYKLKSTPTHVKSLSLECLIIYKHKSVEHGQFYRIAWTMYGFKMNKMVFVTLWSENRMSGLLFYSNSCDSMFIFFLLLSLASSHHCLPKENKYQDNYEQTIVILKEIWNAKRAPNQCVLREIKSRFIFMKYSNKTK